MFKSLGRLIIKGLTQIGQAASMVYSCLFWFVKSPLEFNQTMQQTVKIGVESIVVATLTSLFTGMVLALQAGTTMQSILSEPIYRIDGVCSGGARGGGGHRGDRYNARNGTDRRSAHFGHRSDKISCDTAPYSFHFVHTDTYFVCQCYGHVRRIFGQRI